jgi:hypothetical protein
MSATHVFAGIPVADRGAFFSGLTGRGVETEPIQTLAGSVRRTSVTDPDGNVLNIGEPLA